MNKEIISAKPYKYGYAIRSYIWNTTTQHYTDIKTLCFLADKEQAELYIKGIENQAKEEGKKTTIERTNKWVFLTIEERN